MAIARRNNLRIIGDCGQAPSALYKGRPVGTIGDVGVFSLNYHKHIHTGEGGVITTNDEKLAERCQLIRNHGETAVDAKGAEDLLNAYGQNYRFTELQAAIGIEQLKKLPGLVESRLHNAAYLAQRISAIPGLIPPAVEPGNRHVYYVQAIKFEERLSASAGTKFAGACRAEDPSPSLHRHAAARRGLCEAALSPASLPAAHRGVLLLNCPKYRGNVSYHKGLCPATAERMHFKELLTHEYMRPGMTRADLDDVISAFHKVAENAKGLQDDRP